MNFSINPLITEEIYRDLNSNPQIQSTVKLWLEEDFNDISLKDIIIEIFKLPVSALINEPAQVSGSICEDLGEPDSVELHALVYLLIKNASEDLNWISKFQHLSPEFDDPETFIDEVFFDLETENVVILFNGD